MSEGKVRPFIEKYYPEYYGWEEYPADKCIPFCKVEDEWGILGNFAPVQIVVDGVEFNNTEKLFQIMKFTDKETIVSIYSKKGFPIKWEAQGAEKKGLRRHDWGEIIVDVMKFCLQTKYDQSEEFRKTLEKTRDFVIVEDQTKFPGNEANTWGVKLVGDKYIGSNLLGRLLMELRDNGKLEYHLPNDMFDFLSYLKTVK